MINHRAVGRGHFSAAGASSGGLGAGAAALLAQSRARLAAERLGQAPPRHGSPGLLGAGATSVLASAGRGRGVAPLLTRPPVPIIPRPIKVVHHSINQNGQAAASSMVKPKLSEIAQAKLSQIKKKVVEEADEMDSEVDDDVRVETMDAPEFVEAPENLSGAIAGSMRMKRHLEVDLEAGIAYAESATPIEGECSTESDAAKKVDDDGEVEEPPLKKARLVLLDSECLSKWGDDSDEFEDLTSEKEDKLKNVFLLLEKWGAASDKGAKFVIETLATADEVTALLDASWKPNPSDPMQPFAEQAMTKLFDLRASTDAPASATDMITTFTKKWGLSAEQKNELKKLSYTELQYVLTNYDGDFEILAELAEQGVIEEAADAEADGLVPPPEIPGSVGVMRWLRLEMTDPTGDALVLGDANLSFSALLAKHRAKLGHTGRVVATTFESYDILKERYAEIDGTIKKLINYFGEVWHGVDCTRLAADPRFHGLEESFSAVYYNFPHAGAVKGFFDKHPYIHWRHNNLMALFFRALRYFAKPGAIVKVASNMNAKGCRAQAIISGAESSEFMHMGTIPFTEWILRGYHRSYGDKRDSRERPGGDSYRSQFHGADMVYCFRFQPSGNELPGVPIQQPPGICDFMDSVNACSCGFICEKAMRATRYGEFHFKTHGAHAILSEVEKRKRVVKLYKRFLSEASGVHIG